MFTIKYPNKKALAVLTVADVLCAPCIKRHDLEASEQIQAKPSPLLGQHSRAIVTELGRNNGSVDDLISAGAVAETPQP